MKNAKQRISILMFPLPDLILHTDMLYYPLKMEGSFNGKMA